MKLKKLGYRIINDTFAGKTYYRWIMTEDGICWDGTSGCYDNKADAEKSAIENIDYLCARFNYTR